MEQYMKPSSRQSKSPFKLHESLNKQLSMYSVAAGAAGVGILALAQPAEARIVYTPANVKIVPNKGLIFFDLNHDGIPDFGLSNIYTHSSYQASGFLKVVQAQAANEVWDVTSKGFLCAAALPKNARVGPKGHFRKDPTTGLAMAFSNMEGTYFGPWRKVKQDYLGLKFVLKGKIHFGWARLKGNFNSFPYTATLTGYAYETIPNKPIITGKTKGPDDISVEVPAAALTIPTPGPATLGLLALGSPGVSIWRREELAVAAW
jgi:hypothetical protein